MWVDCPTELDTPILVMGYEVEDLMLGATVMVFCNFVFSSFFPVFAVTMALMWSIKRIKKGRPSGFIIHLAHQKDLLHIPGVLPVKRVWYSPVAGGGVESGRDEAGSGR